MEVSRKEFPRVSWNPGRVFLGASQKKFPEEFHVEIPEESWKEFLKQSRKLFLKKSWRNPGKLLGGVFGGFLERVPREILEGAFKGIPEEVSEQISQFSTN